MNKATRVQKIKVKVKTLLERRCRFPKYEPILKGTDWGKYVPAEDEQRMLQLQNMGEWLKR